MTKRWVRGPALEIMLQQTFDWSKSKFPQHGGPFSEGDEVLLDIPEELRVMAKREGVTDLRRGRLVSQERMHGQLILRIGMKSNKRPGGIFLRWRYWKYVVGWRRP